MKTARRLLPFAEIFLFLPSLPLPGAVPLAAEAPAPPALRLPAGVAPARYAAELWLDPAKETFKGKMEIRISLKGESDTLWLNGKELTIESASARRGGREGRHRRRGVGRGRGLRPYSLSKKSSAG